MFVMGFLKVIRTSFVGLVRHELLPEVLDKPWNDERNEIVRFAYKLLTADPLIGVSVVFAEFSKR